MYRRPVLLYVCMYGVPVLLYESPEGPGLHLEAAHPTNTPRVDEVREEGEDHSHRQQRLSRRGEGEEGQGVERLQAWMPFSCGGEAQDVDWVGSAAYLHEEDLCDRHAPVPPATHDRKKVISKTGLRWAPKTCHRHVEAKERQGYAHRVWSKACGYVKVLGCVPVVLGTAPLCVVDE